jgi:hypothetical protein
VCVCVCIVAVLSGRACLGLVGSDVEERELLSAPVPPSAD